MGGLQFNDYHSRLFALGECNFSDHGANRLGASALMQGLADGYFVIPSTVGNFLANADLKDITIDQKEFIEAENLVNDNIQK